MSQGGFVAQQVNFHERPRKISAWMAERADLVLLTSENLNKEMWLWHSRLSCEVFPGHFGQTNISLTVWHFWVDDVHFTKVGYVSFPEGKS